MSRSTERMSLEPGRQVADVPGRMAAQSAARDLDFKRHPSAQAHHGRRRGLLGPRSAAGSGRPREERQRVRQRHRAKRQRQHAGQAQRPAAASDQHEAAWSARQQRHYLADLERVVEENERLPVGQLEPPQRRPVLEVGRDHVVRHAKHAQQGAEGRGRIQRLTVVLVCAQGQVQLVGITLAEPVRGVDRERGLAHSRHPADHGDRNRRPRLVRVEPAGQCLKFRRPAGEVGVVARHGARRRR